MEKRPRLRNDNQGCHGERMENMTEEERKQDDREQAEHLKEWAEKHPQDNKQGWVAHLFQRFMRRE